MKLRKYPRVVRTQHYDYFKYQKNEMGVPDEDLDYMRYPDDVVTLTASPIEAMIKWLMEDYDPRWSQVVPVRGPFSIIAALCPEPQLTYICVSV